MIDFTGQTYANILAAMLVRVPNTFDKRDGSFMQTALAPAAYALEEYYMALNLVQGSGFVQTATGESLDNLAVIAGLTRYPASPAVRLGVFNVAVPIGARFSTIGGADSINFVVTAATSNPLQFQLTAETAGTIGNGYTGPILPITFVEGLTSSEITDILVPGDEPETDEAFRERLISALNERPFGGNIASYREAIMAIDGVGAVQVYPTWNGGGTVKCSILGSDYNPASSTLVSNVQNEIDPPPGGSGLGKAPIGAQVTIVAPSAVTVNVSAAVTLAPGFTLDQVKPLITAAVSDYLLAVRKDWGTPVSETEVSYSSDVYVSRVLAAMLTVSGVINSANVKLNGSAADLNLTESGTTQEVPVMGTVTLSAT